MTYEDRQFWIALFFMLLGLGYIVWNSANCVKNFILSKSKSKEQKFSELEYK